MKNQLKKKDAERILKRLEKQAKPSAALIKFVHEEMLKEHHYLFQYRNENKHRMGYCTHCKEDFLIEVSQMRTYSTDDLNVLNAKHNETVICPHCGHKVTKRYAGYHQKAVRANVAEFKKDRSGALVAYVYEFVYDYRSNFHIENPIWNCYQIGFFDIHKYFHKLNGWYYGSSVYLEDKYTSQLLFCINKKRTDDPFSYAQEQHEGIACFNLKEILPKTNLKYCCLEEYMGDGICDMFKYLKFYCSYPEITEKLIKEGWANILRSYFWGAMSGVFNFNAKTVPDFFKLNKPHLKAFENSNLQDRGSLKILQFAQERNIELNSENTDFLLLHSDCLNEIKTMLNFMGFKKLKTYVEKQSLAYSCRWSPLDNEIRFFHDYKDYLGQCKQLGYDLTDKRIALPANVSEAHQELTDLINKQKLEQETKKHHEEEKKFQKRLTKLQNKYTFENDEFLIRPATGFADLLAEAAALHHCVYSNYSRPYIVEGKTNIFLIRKKSEPNKPFYTLEYKDGAIIQCRTLGNAGRTPEIDAFLKLWTDFIKQKSIRKIA